MVHIIWTISYNHIGGLVEIFVLAMWKDRAVVVGPFADLYKWNRFLNKDQKVEFKIFPHFNQIQPKNFLVLSRIQVLCICHDWWFILFPWLSTTLPAASSPWPRGSSSIAKIETEKTTIRYLWRKLALKVAFLETHFPTKLNLVVKSYISILFHTNGPGARNKS